MRSQLLPYDTCFLALVCWKPPRTTGRFDWLRYRRAWSSAHHRAISCKSYHPIAVMASAAEKQKPNGINAILLGPPGSGKGTQVTYLVIISNLLYEDSSMNALMADLGSSPEGKILCMPLGHWWHASSWSCIWFWAWPNFEENYGCW